MSTCAAAPARGGHTQTLTHKHSHTQTFSQYYVHPNVPVDEPRALLQLHEVVGLDALVDRFLELVQVATGRRPLYHKDLGGKATPQRLCVRA
jgi:hypothetical protein